MSEALEALRGRDPYDALLGRRVPGFVVRTPRGRQLAIQLRKRCPVDLGPALGVPAFVMAKTVACFLLAHLRGAGDPAARPVFERYLLDAQATDGGWSYEFDVQTRWAFYPAGASNAIATVFAARALATAVAAHAGHLAAREAVEGAAGLLGGPLVAASGSGAYVRYTESADTLVHNANLLACGILAALGRLFSDGRMLETALRCAQTSIAAQRSDGSWPYGVGSDLGWSDNFHTAYNLDGLLMVWLATQDGTVRRSLELGAAHWVRDFFGEGGEPRYYAERALPYDIHAAGTAIDVAARLATWGLPTEQVAWRVAEWTDANLVDPRNGATYYRKHRFWTDRRHFVRWGDAHLAMGRASLALLDTGGRDVLEQAVRRG